MNPKIKSKISRVLTLSVIWYISSVIFVLIEKGVLGDLDYYPSTGNNFNFGTLIIVGPLFSMLAGTVLGFIEVFWLGAKFDNVTFGKKIVLKALFYIVMFLFFTFIGTNIANSFTIGKPVFSKEVLGAVFNFFSSFAYISIILYLGFILFMSLFFLETSNNLGQGVLKNFLTGKYHKPIEEDRIFMFLDMKSSTKHAEKMGHKKYFEYLNSYYRDIADPIVEYYGIIYQYVGDEVVVTWKKDQGLKENRCIQCFQEIKTVIQELGTTYQEKYGVIPEFKAGMHMGLATVGEIGSLKKEIVYSGDVLNTTARIQSLCNEYDADLLISDTLLKELDLNSDGFASTHIGEVSLRGRDEKVELYSITRSG